MTNFEFLNKFLDLQNKVSYDEIFEYGFARTVYSKTDDSVFASFSLINKILLQDQVEKLKHLYGKLDRKLSFYFENGESNNNLKKYLIRQQFKKQYEDSWMFYVEKKKPKIPGFEKVRKVKTNEELKVFLDVFNRSYIDGDPQNPYGNVKNFIPSTITSWNRFGKTKRLEYFIVLKDGVPGAVSVLNNYDGIGYISCVGSLPEHRGQGLGKVATLYAVNQSFENENKLHCLATEEGTYPNEFYKRIGFETKFTAIQMAKEGKK